MFYVGTSAAEFINVNDSGNEYVISMVKMHDKSTFVVCSDYDDDWSYEFYMDNSSDYESVKYFIMDYIFQLDTMSKLLNGLSELFEGSFSGMLVEYEHECHCEGCNCNCEK